MALTKLDAPLGEVGDVDCFKVVGDLRTVRWGVAQCALVPVRGEDEFLEVVYVVPEGCVRVGLEECREGTLGVGGP